jgi:hypothetical protein
VEDEPSRDLEHLWLAIITVVAAAITLFMIRVGIPWLVNLQSDVGLLLAFVAGLATLSFAYLTARHVRRALIELGEPE